MIMNRFIRHIPTFVQLDECPTAFEFNTQEELIAHLESTIKKGMDFYRYSITYDNMIMQEENLGKVWWALGYIKNRTGIDLPEWKLTMKVDL